ncbi:hypothetical protein GOP47_0028763 [Adiantum capillus-veneris]|nr:hypothetical protein GOP47_0028763 [Adiantum capillus-veneris]
MATLQPIWMMGSGPRTHPGGVPDKEWRQMERKKLLAIKREFQQQHQQEMSERRAMFRALTERLKQDDGSPPKEQDLGMFETQDGTPSQRFFPPHAVYSTRMYKKLGTFAREHSTTD